MGIRPGAEEQSCLHADEPAAHNYHFPSGTRSAVLQCLHGQGDVLPVRAGNRQPSGRSASRYNHRIEILQVLQSGFLFHNMDAVLVHLGHQIFVGVANVRFEVRIRCLEQIAAQSTLFEQRYIMAPEGGRVRRFQPCGSPAYHRYFFLFLCWMDGQSILKAQQRVHGAVDGLAQVIAPVQTTLVAADTG